MPRNVPEQAIKAMLSREEALFTQRNPTSKKLSDDAARNWLKGVPMHWMVEHGYVTEGTSSNAYIVKDGKVITRHLSNEILAGCTRRALMRLAKEEGVEIVERKFTVDEALAADEAFLTSASQFVMPIVEIDGHRIGGGQPGPVVRKLREIFLKEASA